jgi:pantetheine-phosphate adenylyltransferase, bacterial
MKKALYPGSFDPVTYGHLDIINRASGLFDELYVAIMKNEEKQTAFSVQERIEMLEKVTRDLPNIKIIAEEGLTIDAARKYEATYLVRGIRAVSDYEYELQLATANMTLAEEIETIFFLTRPEYSFLSSSVAKSVAKNKGDVTQFLPAEIRDEVIAKYQK